MTGYATGEQMHTLGLAMHAHRLTPAEAVELWTTATGGTVRPLTAPEAIELTERVRAMPVIATVLRGPPCDAWPYSSWPSRTRRRHPDAD